MAPRKNRTGPKLKNEAVGPRKMWSGRLDQLTIKALQKHSSTVLSQAEIIDEAVEEWRKKRTS